MTNNNTETMPGMETAESIIGTVAYFDEVSYTQKIAELRAGPEKALDNFKTLFNDFKDFGQFTQERYEQFCQNGIRDIIAEFNKMVEKEAAKTESSILAATIRSHYNSASPVAKLSKLWEAFNAEIHKNGPVSFKHFKVDENGEIVLNAEEFKKIYEQRIETESQAEFFRACHKLRETQQKVLELVKKHVFVADQHKRLSPLVIGGQYMMVPGGHYLSEQIGNEIILSPSIFSVFGRWKENVKDLY